MSSTCISDFAWKKVGFWYKLQYTKGLCHISSIQLAYQNSFRYLGKYESRIFIPISANIMCIYIYILNIFNHTYTYTLPETNIAPEHGRLEDELFLLGWPNFGGYVSFKEASYVYISLYISMERTFPKCHQDSQGWHLQIATSEPRHQIWGLKGV